MPCDLEGNVLSNPMRRYFNPEEPAPQEAEEEVYIYQDHLSKVWFEGFEVVNDKYNSIERCFIWIDKIYQVYRKLEYQNGEIEVEHPYLKGKSISDLVELNLTLTPYGSKMAGLG